MTYSADVLADSPFLYWRLGDAPGSLVAADSSGNARDGALDDANSTSVTALIVADANNARLYSGPGSPPPLAITTSITFGPTAVMTAECWYGGVGGSINLLAGTSTAGISIVADYPLAGDLSAATNTVEDPTIHLATASGTMFNDGLPHYILATAAGGVLTLFLDGVSVATGAYTPGNTFGDTVFFAGTATGPYTLDEVALYDTALSPASIAAHYAAGSGIGPPPPPPAIPPTPVGTGWTLLAVNRANVSQEVKFTDTGQFTHDQSRAVRRAISGFTLLPSEAAKLDLARDSVHAFLRVDDVSYPMGIFYFTESNRQKDAIIGTDGLPTDLIHVSLSDQFIRLQRSDEVPRVALDGADPSQEMIKYIGEAGVPHSVTGSDSNISEDIVWQPFTTYEAIVSQLAELAGHRRPWSDNYGVIRSVASQVVDSEVIPLEDLQPIAGSIVVTENYLSAPNRVVVYDDQSSSPIVGSWDAPASAPNSASNRGWVQTAGVQAQGLSGVVHAQRVARTIGEQMAARRLAGDIVPTNRLDGPVILSWDGALWLVNGWSVSTTVGSVMSFDAGELIIVEGDPS